MIAVFLLSCFAQCITGTSWQNGVNADEGYVIFTSPNGEFYLEFKDSGALDVCESEDFEVIWSTGTSSSGAVTTTMQSNNNLVLHNAAGGVVWQSGTDYGTVNGRLELQDTGKLVMYDGSGVVMGQNGDATGSWDASYDWMAYVGDDQLFRDLSVPGASNAVAHVQSFDTAAARQSDSIKRQLRIGVRYLDLQWQVCGTGCDEFTVVQDTVASSPPIYYGTRLRNIKQWVDEHPTEFVILRMELGGSCTSCTTSQKVQYAATKTEELLWNGQSGESSNILLAEDGHQLGEKTMGDLRGKIWLALADTDEAIWTLHSQVYSGIWAHEQQGVYDFTIQDNFYECDESGVDGKWTTFVGAVQAYKNGDRSRVLVNHLSCNGYSSGNDPYARSILINAKLSSEESLFSNGNDPAANGVIVMDFVTTTEAALIANWNILSPIGLYTGGIYNPWSEAATYPISDTYTATVSLVSPATSSFTVTYKLEPTGGSSRVTSPTLNTEHTLQFNVGDTHKPIPITTQGTGNLSQRYTLTITQISNPLVTAPSYRTTKTIYVPPTPDTQTWSSGAQIVQGYRYYTASDAYLLFQADGNLVLRVSGGKVLWASGSGGQGGVTCYLGHANNLVIKDGNQDIVWQTATAYGVPGGTLHLQDDGNLVIQDGEGITIFSTETSRAAFRRSPYANGQFYQQGSRTSWSSGESLVPGAKYYNLVSGYSLQFQTDHNLVLRDPSSIVWTAETHLTEAVVCQFQGDNNLVMSDDTGEPVWASQSAEGTAGGTLVLQNDGNLVVYDGQGTAIAATGMGNGVADNGEFHHPGSSQLVGSNEGVSTTNNPLSLRTNTTGTVAALRANNGGSGNRPAIALGVVAAVLSVVIVVLATIIFRQRTQMPFAYGETTDEVAL